MRRVTLEHFASFLRASLNCDGCLIRTVAACAVVRCDLDNLRDAFTARVKCQAAAIRKHATREVRTKCRWSAGDRVEAVGIFVQSTARDAT